jgi:hypothetical protein
LYDPRLQETPADDRDRTVRADSTTVTPAVYNEPVRPMLAAKERSKVSGKLAKKPLPSRAERDAGWKPILD